MISVSDLPLHFILSIRSIAVWLRRFLYFYYCCYCLASICITSTLPSIHCRCASTLLRAPSVVDCTCSQTLASDRRSVCNTSSKRISSPAGQTARIVLLLLLLLHVNCGRLRRPIAVQPRAALACLSRAGEAATVIVSLLAKHAGHKRPTSRLLAPPSVARTTQLPFDTCLCESYKLPGKLTPSLQITSLCIVT